MTDHDLERSLSRWFAMEIDASEPAPPSLRASLSSIPDVAPAPRRLVGPRFALLAAVLVTATLLAGAIAVGTGLVELPNVPAPQPTAPPAIVSPDPTASPGETATQGLVAYTVPTRVPDDECSQFFHCIQTRVWVSNADGSEARDLLPDWPGSQTAIAWSGDGTSLFFTHDSEDGGSIADALYVTDASGRRPTLVMTGEPCTGSVCDGIAISPDGRQIAFARGGETESVIAVFEIESRDVREIDATRTGPYMLAQPRWSPDGRTLLYVRTDDSDPARCYRHEAGSLVTVRPDGGELQEIVPIETCAWDPRWSADGSSIVFWSDAHFLTEEVDGLASHELHDVFAVQSDGSGLRRLTDDQISSQASWTRDGRIVFARIPLDDGNGPLGFELWVMDADGGNRSQLDVSDLSALSSLGCVACLYPLPDDVEQPLFGAPPALWQPAH